jgi:hypothetical protein
MHLIRIEVGNIEVRKLQSRTFRYRKSAIPHISYVCQSANPQISTKYCLKTVLKFAFVNLFYVQI